MTTYDVLLKVINTRIDELKLSVKDLSKMVYVNPNILCDYVYDRKVMPADVMFACLSALGIKFEFKKHDINESGNTNFKK